MSNPHPPHILPQHRGIPGSASGERVLYEDHCLPSLSPHTPSQPLGLTPQPSPVGSPQQKERFSPGPCLIFTDLSALDFGCATVLGHPYLPGTPTWQQRAEVGSLWLAG